MPSRPDDLLTLRQAASLVGRSIDTLRRWRGEHGLRDWREASDSTAPSLVSRAEVIDLVARLAASRPDAAGIVDAVGIPIGDPLAQTPTPASLARPRIPNRPPVPTPMHTLDLVAVLVADLRAERDRLQGERDRLQVERDTARASMVAAEVEARALAFRVAMLEALVADGRRSALQAERDRLRPPPVKDSKKKKRRKG
jgi:hypothetical protein